MNKGDLAPDFALLDDQGEERKLTEFLTSGPVCSSSTQRR
jgi:peroxiredoxin Q/BCP